MYEYIKNKQKEWPPATRPFLLFSIKNVKEAKFNVLVLKN
jgi:hypothetical protein